MTLPPSVEALTWRLDYLEKERLRTIEDRKADRSEVTRVDDARLAGEKRLEESIGALREDIAEIKAGTKRVVYLAATTLLTVVGAILVAVATGG